MVVCSAPKITLFTDLQYSIVIEETNKLLEYQLIIIDVLKQMWLFLLL